MIGLIIVVCWFGSGAIGAWAATRHYRRMFGKEAVADLEFANACTVVGGPIGMLGALLYVAASSRE